MDLGPRKLKSEDGDVFEVEESCLQMSNFFKDLINDFPDPEQEIMVNQVKTKELKKIIDYLKHYENEKPKEIKKPLPSGNLKEVLEEWDYNYINPLSLEECIDLLNAAFFLDINELVNLSSAKIASEMLIGTVEEVREKFEWKNMTEEEKIEYGIEEEKEEKEEKEDKKDKEDKEDKEDKKDKEDKNDKSNEGEIKKEIK